MSCDLFSPKHNLTLAEFSKEEIGNVIQLWVDQSIELGQQYKWVQIFEIKGQPWGAPILPSWSNLGSDQLPNEGNKEDMHQGSGLKKVVRQCW